MNIHVKVWSFYQTNLRKRAERQSYLHLVENQLFLEEIAVLCNFMQFYAIRLKSSSSPALLELARRKIEKLVRILPSSGLRVGASKKLANPALFGFVRWDIRKARQVLLRLVLCLGISQQGLEQNSRANA